MNLEYLKSFYITVKYNSISKAAKALHLTQPGLSMQIRNLEKELQADLLIRSNKGVELTEEGSVVYDYAHTLLSIQGNIERDLKSIQQETPKLIIGSCKSVGDYALPCTIYTFKHHHSEVEINMQVNNTDTVIDNLRKHNINIGVIQYDNDYSDINTQTIVSGELCLVGKYSSAPDTIMIEDLNNIPLILRESGSGTRRIIENTLTKHNINIEDLNIVYDLNSPEAIKSSVIAGKGYSFLPKLSIKQELKENILKQIKIENLDIRFDYKVAARDNYTLTKWEQLFVDFLLSSKRGFC